MVTQLDVSTIKELRLTCKLLASTLTPQLLRSVTLNINQHTREKEMRKIRAVAGGNIAISQVTKELTIRGLSPAFDRAKGREAQAEMKACLRAALVALISVQKVS